MKRRIENEMVLKPCLCRAGLLALALTAAFAMPAWAQDDPPAAETETAAEEVQQEGALGEEIVVTARKREENLQEVPVAVTVMTGETLADTAATDLSDLQASVPNLAIYAGRGQSTTLTVFLRGIGQADPLWGVDPGVGLYFDDVYYARPQGALLDLMDVSRIEVLRGPQGTLYGKNTIGGAIKYVSRPLTDETEGMISFSPGSDGNQDIKLSASGALVEGKVRAKVSFGSFHHDGYGKNLFTGREVSDRNTKAFRLAMDWLPSDTVKVQLALDRTEDSAEPKGLTRLEPNRFCPLFGLGTCPNEANVFDTRSGLAPLNGTDSQGASLNITWDGGDAWQLKSITAYRDSDSLNNIDFDTLPARIADVIATYYDKQFTQELQLIYSGERWNGVLGAYYFDGEAGGLVKNIFLNSIFGTTDGYSRTDSIALFGDGSYAVSDKLRLNFGLRATQEKKNTFAFNAGYTNDTFTVVNAVTASFDKTKTFDSLAPKLGLDYQLSDDVMAYATLSRGFKSGGYNVRAQATVFPRSAEPFDDEVLDMLELGIKSVLADRSLVLNTAVFYGKYEDIQVSTFTAYDSNGDGTQDAFFGNFLNAGSSTLKGLEVEFDWSPQAVDWFGISGNASWLDNKPDDFLDENNDGFVDTQVISNAPEYTGLLRFNFDFPAFGGLITASAGAAFRDDSILTNEGGQYPGRPGVPLRPIMQPAYETYDAWISWLSGDATWRFGVAGKNLSDEEFLTNGYNIPALGVLQGSYGPPRTVIATLEYRF
jgi:iron complex outermembrane recepter protein